ncbi:MAG: metal ABC transporter permease [Candidatus Marinimicrobia bacterium]|nr:metal ABC transporter permease [Candidatus Neomarinimicrobiota bacterium]
MGEILKFMAAPFFVSVVLVGLHTYMGLHVVLRGIIFIDIALAQVAAVGSAVALLFGAEIGSSSAYLVGLFATCIGAGILSLTRTQNEKVPQEAFIGITYVVASALMILVLTGVAHGAEQIKALLVGSILWVKCSVIYKVAIVYLIIGLLHWIWRKRFLLISLSPDEAVEKGISVRFWDLLFYLTLGFMVTISVQIAGVLLVFTFLVVPAVMGVMVTDSLWGRLIFGWIVGVVVSFIGCITSYYADLPTGATIICVFGIALILLVLAREIFKGKVVSVNISKT